MIKNKLKLISAILPLGMISNPAVSEVYPTLSENIVESNSYQIHKALGGSAFNSPGFFENIFFIAANDQFLIKTEVMYSDQYDFWKMDKKGQVIDTFVSSDTLHVSGYFLGKDYYIDWPLTGNKSKHLYSQIIDDQQLSNKEFEHLLNKADVVKFEKYSDLSMVRCYLKIGQSWLVIESKKRFNSFSNDLSGLNKGVILKGFTKPKADQIISLEEVTLKQYNVNNPNSLFKIEKFIKKGRQRKSFFSLDINNNMWQGDYGLGHYQITHQKELLNFKSVGYRNLRGNYSSGLHFYTLPEAYQYRFDGLFFKQSTRAFNKVKENQQGLYLLTKKEPAPEQPLKNQAAKTLIYQQTFDWQPSFSGFYPEKSELRQIRYFNGQDEIFEQHALLNPVALTQRAIPKEISFYHALSEPNDRDDLYLFNNQLFSWPDIYGVLFTVFFDEQEIVDAFQQFASKNMPITLEFNIEKLDQFKLFSMQLSSGEMQFPIKYAKLRNANKRYNSNENRDQKVLKDTFEYAMKNQQGVDVFLTVSLSLVKNSDNTKRFGFQLADHTSKLLIRWIGQKKFKPAKSIFNHY
ncbi:MAG: hypothetical protein L3J22_07865 [Xanthomonadales bacterium]|nr:hypothetical protein [Xanthomonadales bacterium]